MSILDCLDSIQVRVIKFASGEKDYEAFIHNSITGVDNILSFGKSPNQALSRANKLILELGERLPSVIK